MHALFDMIRSYQFPGKPAQKSRPSQWPALAPSDAGRGSYLRGKVTFLFGQTLSKNKPGETTNGNIFTYGRNGLIKICLDRFIGVFNKRLFEKANL
jgi:hypothetical protein